MLGSLREYVSSLSARGTLHSEGSFTVDTVRAAQVMGLHALPSPFHHLLKVVQVANRVGAQSLRLSVTGRETRLEFTPLPSQAALLAPAMDSALRDSAIGGDSLAGDLSLALLGGVGAGHSLATWRVMDATSAISLSLDHEMRASRANLGPDDKSALSCSFVTLHNDGLRFWRTARRKAAIKELLDSKCAFSATRLWLDQKELPPPGCAFFNAHLKEPLGAKFNVATGVIETVNTRVAATNLLFDIADPQEPCLAVSLPLADYYTQRRNNVIVFSKALQPDNVVRPDGLEVCAWMLQFIRQGERVPRPDEAPFRAVIAFNIHGPGNNDPPRLKVVRHGVLLMDAPLARLEELEPFRGCSLLVAHDGFHTDASGLQIVEDDDFVDRLLEFRPLIDLGHAYFEEAAAIVHLC